MAEEEKPPLSAPSTSYTPPLAKDETSHAPLDVEAASPSAPPRSWIGRFKMAYARRGSRRPSPPPSTPAPVAPPHHPLHSHATDDADPDAGSSKKVLFQDDTAALPTVAYHPPSRDAPRSRTPISNPTDDQPISTTHGHARPNMLILLREDYFSIRNFWRTADRKDLARKLIARSMWKWYAIVIVAAVLTALLAVYHDQVVHWCHPIAREIRSWPAGFLIPIVLLVVLSYPPLVGHEIIGILIGLVWDLGKGFAILAAGTFIGEVALWVSFKWCCQARAAKFEKKNKLYSSLTTLIREKTFVFVLILRFSAVPGHITTAVSASAGANFWAYLLAAFLTLPKQFAIVYLGSAFGTKSTKNTLISTAVMVITIIGTFVAAGYIYYQMRLVMRRRALLIPVAAVPLGDQPTWGDVANAEQIARRQSHMAGHNQKVVIVSPDGHVGSPISFDPNALRARASNSVFPNDGEPRGHTPMRAWSVPHRMTQEEYQEWVAMKAQDTPVAESSTAAASDAIPDLLKWQDSFRARSSTLSRDESTTTLLGTNGSADHADPLYPPPPTSPSVSGSDRVYGRGTVSLDLGRSNSNPTRMSGRQIADDADLYAFVHGGRRPDFGRMRGDSGADLLRRDRESSLGSDDAPGTDGDGRSLA